MGIHTEVVENDFKEMMDHARGLMNTDIIKRGVRAGMNVIQAQVQRNAVAKLNKDPTGALAAGFRTVVRKTARGKAVGHLHGVPYARIHDKGGTIKSKGKMLALPMKGQPKGITPDTYSGELKAWATSTGKVFLWDITDKKKPFPVFFLTNSVTIRATNYVHDAYRQAERDVMGAFAYEVSKHLGTLEEE